jgi:fatty acid desaturase
MKQRFAEQGLLDASPVYYVRKCLELIGMLGVSLHLLFAYSSSPLALLASSLLMAVFIFQCGWTCHDFNHNQVSWQWCGCVICVARIFLAFYKVGLF